MTVLHLAAKYGHVVVLEVLRGKVPWSMASVKVCFVFETMIMITNVVLIVFMIVFSVINHDNYEYEDAYDWLWLSVW